MAPTCLLSTVEAFMSSKLKWVGIAILLIIVILFVLPFLIPVNKFRPTIEEKASAALGRKVQLGDLSLSILSGSVGIDNVSVSDDPKFNAGPFLTAKKVKVGVELIPLIFSQQLNVTEITVEGPQVTMLKDPSGKWNFSSIGGSSSAPTPASSSSNSAESVSIKELNLSDGQLTLGSTNSQKRTVYNNLNLTASDVAVKNSFPVTFSMDLPGGGSMKIDGKFGPVDEKDAAFTPQDVKLTVSSLNLASSGFLDPKLGLGGIADVNANLQSKSGVMAIKGELKFSKAVLVAGGQPAGVPAVIDFDTNYDLAKSTGVLNPSTLKIGNAKANLSGTYKSEGEEFGVDMKVAGEGMPATDLESFLPALGITLPSGSKLSGGTLSTNLHMSGPTDKLATDGNVGLYNGVLSGFDLGSKLSGLGALAGIKTGRDLIIEKMTSNLHMSTSGIRTDKMDLVIPSLGEVVGGGTIDSKSNLNFNLVATVKSGLLNAAGGGAVGQVSSLGGIMGGGGSKCKDGGIKVPMQIHGTTSNPQFLPDVGGATAGLLKSELTCGAGGAGGLAGAAAGGGAGAATGAVGQLGGLFGKKKKP
jgi:AsmA protein